MRLLILSDIHGNLTALERVLVHAYRGDNPDALVLLGDNVDYGPRSNEVIARLSAIDTPLVCSLWGNHEKAILDGEYERFSSLRGVKSAQYTAQQLDASSVEWIQSHSERNGYKSFVLCGKRFFAVHGSIQDPYWGTISPASVSADDYAGYDVVLSGHSHIPHAFGAFYAVDDPKLRGKQIVEFINPGSVGQPRNRDPRASYAVWDSEQGISLVTVPYDIELEQRCFDSVVDGFYSSRLEFGV